MLGKTTTSSRGTRSKVLNTPPWRRRSRAAGRAARGPRRRRRSAGSRSCWGRRRRLRGVRGAKCSTLLLGVGVLVLRDEQHAVLVADVDRQGHVHVGEDDDVFEGYEEQSAQQSSLVRFGIVATTIEVPIAVP